MIWVFLINGFLGVLGGILAVFGSVEELPLIDDSLVQAMGYFWFFADLFPPLYTIYAGFMSILLFEVVLLTLRALKIFR